MVAAAIKDIIHRLHKERIVVKQLDESLATRIDRLNTILTHGLLDQLPKSVLIEPISRRAYGLKTGSPLLRSLLDTWPTVGREYSTTIIPYETLDDIIDFLTDLNIEINKSAP